MSCPVCGETSTTGLCPQCTGQLKRALSDIPGIWLDLQFTLVRLRGVDYAGTGTGGNTRKATDTPLPYHAGAARAGRALARTIDRHIRLVGVIAPRPCPYVDVPSRARWLLDHLHQITRSDLAAALHHDLVNSPVIKKALHEVDIPPVRVYRGKCNGQGSIRPDGTPAPPRVCAGKGRIDHRDGDQPCCQDMYVVIRRDPKYPDRTLWRCPTCGLTYDEDRRWNWITTQYRGGLVTIREARRLVGVPTKVMEGWVRRKRVEKRGEVLVKTELGSERPAALYALDDLLALAQEGTTAA